MSQSVTAAAECDTNGQGKKKNCNSAEKAASNLPAGDGERAASCDVPQLPLKPHSSATERASQASSQQKIK